MQPKPDNFSLMRGKAEELPVYVCLPVQYVCPSVPKPYGLTKLTVLLYGTRFTTSPSLTLQCMHALTKVHASTHTHTHLKQN